MDAKGNWTGERARNVGMDNRAYKELERGGFLDPQNQEHQQVVRQVLHKADPSKIDSSWGI